MDNENADATASYNFLSAQTNLPGFDQTTGHAYASFLLGAVATSSRTVQAVNTDYNQRDFAFYVQDDFKVSSKLTLNLGLRWQILPGMYEKNGFVTNGDLTLPNAAAGNLPGALRFADQEGRKTYIDTYYKQFQPRLGMAYAMSSATAISAGYSSSNRPATAYSGGDDFGGLNSTGYNGSISVTRATQADAERPGSGHVPERALPEITRATLPNYDPALLNNQNLTQVLTGDEAKREQYHNYNVTVRQQLPASFSTTIAFIGAQGRRLPGLTCSAGGCGGRQRDQPHAVRGDRSVRRPAVQLALEPAAARDRRALPGLHRNGPAGAQAVPAIHGRAAI